MLGAVAVRTWVWRHNGSPCAPPFHEEGAPDAMGCVLKHNWDPLKSPCPLLFPHRADSGRQPGCRTTKPRTCLCLPAAPRLSVGNLSSSQWLRFHCCLWAPCRSHYTNTKEALHPKSVKLLKNHICSSSVTHRNWGLVSKILNFYAAKFKENNWFLKNENKLEMEETPSAR